VANRRGSPVSAKIAAAPTGDRPVIEVVRPGQMEGFKKQAAECIRLTREKDTGALRYDLCLSSDGTQCEVGEAYIGAQGLIEHRANVEPALQALSDQYGGNHHDHPPAAVPPVPRPGRGTPHDRAHHLVLLPRRARTSRTP
jgi:quinol monooxygenase YgiN